MVAHTAGSGGGRGGAPRPLPPELAGYEVPKSFIFVPDLPRTASGKLMRTVLR